MKIENYVTSPEISDRLKEAGFKRDTLWAWYKNAGEHTGAIVDYTAYEDSSEDFKDSKVIPAYIFNTLWGVLPSSIEDGEFAANIVLEAGYSYLRLKMEDYDECDSSYDGYFPSQYEDIPLVQEFDELPSYDKLVDTVAEVVLWGISRNFIELT